MINIPAIAALIRFEQVAAINVFTPYLAMKSVLDGHNEPNPPINIPIDAILAKPHNAKLNIILVFLLKGR